MGRLIRSTEYDADNTIVQRTEHLYDEYSRLSSQSWVIQGDPFSESYVYNDPPTDDQNVGADDSVRPKDGSLAQMTTAIGATIDYNYDAIKRLSGTTVKNSSGVTVITHAYAYKNLATTNGITQTTSQVEYHNVRDASGTVISGAKYTYDQVGNIIQISQSTSPYYPLVKYTYDVQNQLIKEEYYDGNGTGTANITATYEYTYDTAGNILTESKNGTVTKTYTYGNGDWNDLLTVYNSGKIAYEGQQYSETTNALGIVSSSTVTGTPVSGNPVSYFNGVRWEFEWEQGRNLNQAYNFSTNSIRLSATKVDTETTLNYSYDFDGIRTGKTSVVQQYGYSPSSGGGVVASIGENTVEPNATSYVRYLIGTTTVQHSYVTQNGKVVRETIGSGANAQVLDFIYDASGRPFALKYTSGAADPVTYYYVLNLQGDVVGLTDADGACIVKYHYNAWGAIIAVTDADDVAITDLNNIAHINPLRYRGYYYDVETGFYYLQSRYYDPTMHRFINADSYASTGQSVVGTNMFIYCNNCPIVYKDISGNNPIAITVTVTAADVLVITITAVGVVIATYVLVELTVEALEELWALAEMLGAKIFYDESISIAVPTTQAFSKSKEKTKVAVAEAVASETINYSYWEAWLVGKKIVIGRGLTLKEAAIRVACGNNLMCKNEAAAITILFVNGYVNAVGPEIGSGEGYYWHYHPHRHTHTHIWFYKSLLLPSEKLEVRD